MKLFTAQMALHRKLKTLEGIVLLDTTVKTGELIFAPSWDMVMGVKNGTLSEEVYTQLYLDRMRESYQQNTARWHTLFDNEVVVAFCYCPAGSFCHRYQLAEMLGKVAKHKSLPFTYLGELRSAADLMTLLDKP